MRLELIWAVFTLLVGVRGWNTGRTLAPLPDGCRVTDYAQLQLWFPALAPLHVRILRWKMRLAHARLRRRLMPNG